MLSAKDQTLSWQHMCLFHVSQGSLPVDGFLQESLAFPLEQHFRYFKNQI